jgi:hypothetical protein
MFLNTNGLNLVYTRLSLVFGKSELNSETIDFLTKNQVLSLPTVDLN